MVVGRLHQALPELSRKLLIGVCAGGVDALIGLNRSVAVEIDRVGQGILKERLGL
ncbi:MAG: hypothetical protein PVSMB1_12680 [Gemmatimonadaceae bacterium]